MNDGDVDAEFESLIRAEFGDDFDRPDAEPTAERRSRRPVRRVKPQLFDPQPPQSGDEARVSDPRSWSVADEPDDFEKPPPPPPVGKLSSMTWLGIVLIVGGVAVAVARLLGFLPQNWAWGAVGAIGIGIVVLFTRLPRDRDEDDEGGAVI